MPFQILGDFVEGCCSIGIRRNVDKLLAIRTVYSPCQLRTNETFTKFIMVARYSSPTNIVSEYFLYLFIRNARSCYEFRGPTFMPQSLRNFNILIGDMFDHVEQ